MMKIEKIWFRKVVIGFLFTGVISISFYLYDIIFPNHFVGDMYGLEVIYRLFLIVIPAIMFFVGLFLVLRSLIKSRSIGLVSSILVIVSSILLLSLSGHTLYSRIQWRIRETYPSRSVAELLRIAREEKDQFAMDALLIKKDPSAVPGLSQILLDENEVMPLRVGAAHALGEIGGEDAKNVLEKVKARNPPEMLRIAVEYSLETRIAK